MQEIRVNEYQTPINDELFSDLPDEVREQFFEFYDTVEYIQILTNPDRPHAKDLPRDSEGKIIVDITHPHLLDNMDYFRQPALHFMEYGCYTKLKPNSNPNSEYRKYWEEERRRCLEGYVRESDGEWVTGMMYWFMNYTPMMVNVIIEGTKTANRVESFPLTWEGIYWRFHYLQQARMEGKNAIELAKRSVAKAHPYDAIVYTPEGKKLWKDIKIGDALFDDEGNITTVIDIPFDGECDIYELTLIDGRKIQASGEHLWDVEIRNHKSLETLSTLELLNIYKRKRNVTEHCSSGIEYVCSIQRNKGVDWKYSPTKVDPYTFGLLLGDGCFRHRSCYFTQKDTDLEEERQFIPYSITRWSNKCQYKISIQNWTSILKSYGLYWVKSEDKFIPDEYKFNSREVRLGILKGLMDSDGFLLEKRNRYQITLSSKRLIEDIQFICRSLGYNCSYTEKKTGYKINGVKKECLPSYCLSIHTRDEIANLNRKKRKEVIVKNEKTIARELRTRIIDIKYVGKKQAKCVSVDNESHRYLIGEFITTHNSYTLASIMTHNLILGENLIMRKRNIVVLAASSKEYIKEDKDGSLSKFVPMLNFVLENTPYPKLLRKKSSNDMAWVMGYESNGVIKGSGNTVMAVSTKDDSDKLRGKRGWILYEEMGNYKNLLSVYDSVMRSTMEGNYSYALQYLVGCVCAGTKVWTLDGRNINIEELKLSDGIIGFTDELYTEDKYLSRGITKEPIVSDIFKNKKECVRITLNNGNYLECSIDHPIVIQKKRYTHKGLCGYDEVFVQAQNLKIGDRVLESRAIPIFGNDVLFDPRLVGMLIGDGTYGSSVGYCSEDRELLDYVQSRYGHTIAKETLTKKGNIYREIHLRGVRGKLNEIGLLGQTKQKKRLPKNYQTLNEEHTKLLLSGLYDTDGSICINKADGYIYITQCTPEILKQIQLLWRKFGVFGTITTTQPTIREDRKDKNPWYTLTISGRRNCLNAAKALNLLVQHKKENLQNIVRLYENKPVREQLYPTDVVMHKVIGIEYIGEQDVYNLTAGLSHTYLANNIITHNTSNNKEADFQAAKTLLYKPEGYNIKALKNVYDRKGEGKKLFGFFFPAYVNRLGCYDKNGNSDVVKALIEILMARYEAKHSADPQTVLTRIAEDPITPAEAMLKVKAAFFPVQQLNERLRQIEFENVLDTVLVGTLVNVGNEMKFVPTSDQPIRKYPVENTELGAIEIYCMPEKNSNGKIPNGRYIAGHDPVDNDQADSSSLSSSFVFDTWTDEIVAEYTGRQPYADDNFEILRKLCIFYNAKCLYESNKKGCFAYFKKMNCIEYLADTPQYLRDKNLVKYSAWGSNSKGVNASQGLNNYANSLINEWLKRPITMTVTDKEGNIEEYTTANLYKIKAKALLEELVAFRPELNVDRIRSLGMVMLLREASMIECGGDLSKLRVPEKRITKADDPFFKKNWEKFKGTQKHKPISIHV